MERKLYKQNFREVMMMMMMMMTVMMMMKNIELATHSVIFPPVINK